MTHQEGTGSEFIRVVSPFHSAVDCGTPQEVAHAEVRANGSRLHDVATYRCNAGYRMTGGDPQLVCQHEAEWEGAPPLCTGK